jgi:hypothetical protein
LVKEKRMSTSTSSETATIQHTLTDLAGNSHPIEVLATRQRVFEDRVDAPPYAVVIFELMGPPGLEVPAKVQLELATGAITELELVYGLPLLDERA